jgi:hypothetical protein
MSTIAAGTTSGTALVSTGNTDGTLQLQVNGTTPSVTLAANGAVGVGSTPGYGTSGQVLTSTPATPASGLTLLSTVTASASATVDMETTFSSTYDAYLIIGAGIVISNDGGSFSCRLKIGGSYSTTDYKGHFMQVASGSASYAATANATSSIGIAASVGNVTNEGLNFTMKVYLPSGATLRNMVTGEVVYTRDSSDVLQGGAFLGGNTVAGAVTGVRFLPSSGTITSGVFRLYGFANS